MTVQISVMVWTVICFLILLLIVRNLLFRPLLSVMDNREARLAAARRKAEEDKQEEERLLQTAEEEAESNLAAAKAGAETSDSAVSRAKSFVFMKTSSFIPV